MLSGVLSDAYIKANCWEFNAPLSFKKTVMKPITIAPIGNMRNSFTFTAPQPTLLHLATNIIASTPKKNLPTNTNIVSAVVESLVKAENDYIPSEFMIRYDPTYDYQTGGEARQGRDAMLALQEIASQMSGSLIQERLQDVASQMSREQPYRGETPFRPNLSPSQQARFNQAENRGPLESPVRPEGMYRRTRGIPGRYGGVEGVPDTPE
jgi:hypothetical protein